ncbi:MAG: CPBP family intramembrane glutamic endopeptidase [Polyangia bacterium]|jgi:hypothetical protein|nr:CPBP family intramembrane glutamic endopeptidase [Polyangia bacterium]
MASSKPKSTRRTRTRSEEAARQRSLWTYLSTRPNWPTELLFIVPVFLVYQAGTFFTDQQNGVDLVTTLIFRLRIASEHAFIGLSAVTGAALLGLFLWTRRKQRFQLRMIGPLLLESGLYALLMGNAILLLMTKVLGLPPPTLGAPEALDPWMVIYVSAGAGLHEELVFRLLLFGSLLWILGRAGLRPFIALFVALATSAVLFSAAHHLPPHGEPFTTFAFVYRLLAGVVFGLLYHYRGLATAVWSHFLYDVLVLGVWR